MAFAILKLSYKRPGDSTLEGGICGTGFFINEFTAVTANHVLNDQTFKPNTGFDYCCLWLLSRRGSIIPLEYQFVEEHPEIDTSVVRFEKPNANVTIYRLSETDPEKNTKVYGIGHIGHAMPQLQAQWGVNTLEITAIDLASVVCDKQGYIKRQVRLDVNANDIKVNNLGGYEVSFGSRVGMSGGPLIDKESDKVLGLLSLGLPVDANVKTQTFAVKIGEIKRYVLNEGT